MNLVQNHPIFKEINQEFDGIFTREINGKVQKPLNELLRISTFDELHNINHMLSDYYGGITDGKGELTLDLATISHKLQVSDAQFKPPVDFKRFETISSVREDSDDGAESLREEAKAPFWHDQEYSREVQMEFVRKQAQKRVSTLFGGGGPKGLALLQNRSAVIPGKANLGRRNIIRPDARPLKERDNPFKLPRIDEKPKRPNSASKRESEEDMRVVLQRNTSMDAAKKEQIAILNKIEEQTSLLFSPGKRKAEGAERPLVKAKRNHNEMLEMVYRNAGFEVSKAPDYATLFRNGLGE